MIIGSSNDSKAVKEQYATSTHFSNVKPVYYEDSLHIIDIEDLVEYLKSLASFKAIIDLPVSNIRNILETHFENGAIDLPKDYGMFISR